MHRTALPARSVRPTHLPAYALYGELQGISRVDRLHCETIAERSRLHDWEIRPHRHEALLQWLVVARGRADARLDGHLATLDGPAVVCVPALAAHGFRFAPEVEGTVFTVEQRHLHALLAADPTMRDTLMRLRAWMLPPGGAAATAVLAAADALRSEVQGDAPWRGTAIDAALLHLALAMARSAPPGPAAVGEPPSRALAHVQRLRALVEASYREQPSLVALAAQVGITPTQLNRVCRQWLGQSAHGVLHARVVLEAQRELSYTAQSVKQVAFGLGFADAAYFTRFFQRHTGHTPTGWRSLGDQPAGKA